ncbi:hypothetical protein EHP00_2179 [Ecytonucleospora hepatopenaei]|uniref:DUF4203 domain-containing protein n=1 Tax=Ecytonucleospora hepatopenaei TaxID=646526 RepID=A0A1W0E6T4_9MICR|nr:hypothetical protein EHP00_2179 [Ecytonucleospora hepatopenaei]
MLFNFVNLVAAADDNSEGSYFFGNFEIAIMNIASASLNAGANIADASGIWKVINLNVLYLLIMINAASALTFAGIVYERVGVIFFMTVFVYTFFGMFGSVFDTIGDWINVDGKLISSIFAFLICASFLVFYAIVKPVFMAMIIFLVFNAIAGNIGAVPFWVHILVFVGIIIAVKMLFKVLSKAYKYVVIGMFALYGSLILLSSTYGLVYLPLNWGEYINEFIDQGSVWGPLVESWNSLIWLLFIIGGCGAQFKLLDKRYESEDETTSSSAEETPAESK